MKQKLTLLTTALSLAVLATTQSHAASKTWNNGAANFTWDLSSANWTPGGTWVQGNDAIFGPTGVGSINLGADNISVSNMIFTADGYTINTGTSFFTNSVITSYATNNLAISIYGPQSLTFLGTNTTILLGVSGIDANHYGGSTFVKGGTVILRAANVTSGGASFAVSNVLAIDAGATLQIGTLNDGSANTVPPNGQIAQNGTGPKLVLTGGVLDENGNNNNHNYPPFEGTGRIINSSIYIRAVHKTSGGIGTPLTGTPYVFSGTIEDSGLNATTSQGVAHQMNVDMNGGSYAPMVWSGSNSFTGFLRLNSGPYGNMVKLLPGGTLGYPTPINCPARQILMNSGCIDLNGTSQKVGYVYTGNDANSIITNSAFGTTSTLTVGFNCTNLVAFNGAATPRGIRNGLRDDPTVAGTIALVKEGVCIQPIGTYAADINTGPNAQCNYHGDTTVNNGILEVLSTTGISANSAYRLNSGGVLQLDYAGTANVKQLFVNGAQKANGTYGASNFPGIITGTGTITVTGSTGVDKIWDGATDLAWNTTTANWTGSTFNQGESAIFNAAGAGTVSLSTNIGFSNITFNASRNIEAAGFFSTNLNSTIAAATGTSNYLGLSMYGGTGSITFTGQGTTMLGGDTTVNDANHFTGGAYFRSGTVILNAKGSGNGSVAGSSHAIESIEALDTGATLVIPNFWNGSTITSSDRDQVGAAIPGTRLNMTGGTIDLNDCSRNNSQNLPIPDGSGLIVNNGSHAQAGLFIIADGLNHTFSGVIADGNGGVLSTNNNTGFNPGYQIGIVQVNGSKNGGGGVWTLSGPNTFSGSIRLSSALGIKLSGQGTLGSPTPNGLTGPLRIADNNSFIDLNGTSQTIALMTAGNAPGRIFNSAVGTVSTLTCGYGNEQASRNAPYVFKDNDGVGGILALRKINTAPWTSLLSGGVPATNCIQGLRNDATCTYSGDTTILNGTWDVQGTGGISPNSAYRIYTGLTYGPGVLKLSYAGNANCRQLWINGVQQPNGVYGAGTTGIDPASTGTITVTGFAPATITAVQSGSNLNLSWAGVYKLQSSTNNVMGPYTDYAGAGLNSASIPINPNIGAVYFRLSTY